MASDGQQQVSSNVIGPCRLGTVLMQGTQCLGRSLLTSMYGRSVMDCCYALGSARLVQQAAQEGQAIRVQSYDTSAPTW